VLIALQLNRLTRAQSDFHASGYFIGGGTECGESDGCRQSQVENGAMTQKNPLKMTVGHKIFIS
jgi:hypothetical protein